MNATPPAKLTIIAGVLYVMTGILHSFGLSWATGLAAQGPHDLAVVIPTLWLGTTAAMLVVGIMLILIGRRPGPTGRALVGLAALVPLANAGMLIAATRDSPPAFVFAVVALATLAATWKQPAA